MSKLIKPSLYGIKNSNRDFTNEQSWGKNQFSTSFPAALACYMHSQSIQPVYLKLNDKLKVHQEKIDVEGLFQINPAESSIFFSFETSYLPYSDLMVGSLPRIDLVIMDSDNNNKCLQGLEIKLTAVPDDTTWSLSNNQQSSEIVVRPDTIVYLALSIAKIFQKEKEKLENKIGGIRSNISDWTDPLEIGKKLPKIMKTLDKLLLKILKYENPLLIQPIWRTEQKSTILSEKCLDMFIWGNLAFTRLFFDAARENPYSTKNKSKLTRNARSVVWLAKMLCDFTDEKTNSKMNPKKTIDELVYFTKNDKAFARSGRKTIDYLKSDELLNLV